MIRMQLPRDLTSYKGALWMTSLVFLGSPWPFFFKLFFNYTSGSLNETWVVF